jgi:hypothetical protein
MGLMTKKQYQKMAYQRARVYFNADGAEAVAMACLARYDIVNAPSDRHITTATAFDLQQTIDEQIAAFRATT